MTTDVKYVSFISQELILTVVYLLWSTKHLDVLMLLKLISLVHDDDSHTVKYFFNISAIVIGDIHLITTGNCNILTQTCLIEKCIISVLQTLKH